MLETFRQVEEQVFAISDRVTGRLRVAAIYSVGLLEMAEMASGYRAAYPDVSLSGDYRHPEEAHVEYCPNCRMKNPNYH